ncbi:hypothetical protein Tco_0994073, partial [Tanacetum coccineum]
MVFPVKSLVIDNSELVKGAEVQENYEPLNGDVTKRFFLKLVNYIIHGIVNEAITKMLNIELSIRDPSVNYSTDVYSPLKILSVVRVKVEKLHGYGYLEEIIVRRADRELYTFKEGDFVNLHLNDIEDMLLLVVRHKLFHL